MKERESRGKDVRQLFENLSGLYADWIDGDGQGKELLANMAWYLKVACAPEIDCCQ